MGYFAKGSPRHLVRYGIPAEQKYLSDGFLETYDLLVVNANMVSHAPSALAAFVGERAKNKPFLVDPLTHAFQHDISLLQAEDDEGTPRSDAHGFPILKRSFDKLMKCYGEPILRRASCGEVVRPSDFGDPSLAKGFSQRVRDFQMEVLAGHADERGLTEYYEFVGVHRPVTPIGVVAPYFYLESPVDEWLSVNKRLVEATVAISSGPHDVYAQLVVSGDVLADASTRTSVQHCYRELPVDAVLLWVDQFDEHRTVADHLRNYLSLAKTIGEKRPVVMLYGSFFSVAAMRFLPEHGLAGVCHSLEYGEDRAVIPAGGGLPMSRFFYPGVFRRLRYPDALRLARPFLGSADLYESNVCGCPMCLELLRSYPPDQAFGLYGKSHPITFQRRGQAIKLNYPDTDTRDRCVRHFMWNKHREFSSRELSLTSAIDLLDQGARKHQELGLSELSHCVTWAEVLRKPCQT